MHTTSSPPVSVAEAAALLDVTPTWLHRRIKGGRVQAHKLPGRTGAYILDQAEVDRLVLEKTCGLELSLSELRRRREEHEDGLERHQVVAQDQHPHPLPLTSPA